MSRVIIHNNGVYNVYSTVIEKSIFVSGLTFDMLKKYWQDEYGRDGMCELSESALEYIHEHGTSSVINRSLADTINCNFAGEHDEHLTTEEFIEKYLTIKEPVQNKDNINLPIVYTYDPINGMAYPDGKAEQTVKEHLNTPILYGNTRRFTVSTENILNALRCLVAKGYVSHKNITICAGGVS